MIADIASGHVDAADVLFLIAAVLFAVAAAAYWSARAIAPVLSSFGLALVAIGWLVL